LPFARVLEPVVCRTWRRGLLSGADLGPMIDPSRRRMRLRAGRVVRASGLAQRQLHFGKDAADAYGRETSLAG
jgi:hypothetical protein